MDGHGCALLTTCRLTPAASSMSAQAASLLAVEIISSSISAAVGQIAGKAIQRPSQRIAINEDRDTFGFAERPHSVYVPVQSVSELRFLPDLGARTRNSKPYRWVDMQGGFDLLHTSFQFVVHAHNATVDIIGAEPLVEPITLPPGIALVRPPIGGPLGISHLSVNLDAATAEHRHLGDSVVVRDLESPKNQYVSPLAVTLKPGESQLFHVEAFTIYNSYRWALLLKTLVNGKKRDETLTRCKKRPFVTMKQDDPAITARFEFDRGQWVPPVQYG
ncbi:hypothetical protein MSIMFB_01087 [Mycobacterium simulans]|uniref:Uncharacterized protein n=1 Tax=Mycobacterium simulans TaxID=627089 RepID=A0A7Z7IHL2_9MYCO|nr:hypothetical protein [Mycobacterium simulans]SOJ53587.1 hypothetical protein MSIMFB_01087 [Mycobacterium simulans]